MQITATELKANLGKYLALAESEDIYVTKNGRNTVTISNPNKDRLKIVHALYGTLPNDASLDKSRKAMLSKKLGYDI